MVDSSKETKEGKVTHSFGVSDMPLGVWKRFKEFSESECGDCYWMAIDKLLSLAEQDWKYESLHNHIVMVDGKLNEMMGEFEESSSSSDDVLTLGKGD